MIEGAYNKTTGGGNGTLVANWQEERSLRDFTGVGRAIVKEHIPKRHLQFDEPIKGKEFDNTKNRIYGESREEIMKTNNHEYGTGKNNADGIARVGRKQQNFEKQIQATIAAEIAEKERNEEEMRQMRYFDTTTKDTYYGQDMTANTVGRKVMRTQDGSLVPMENRDQALIVEGGIYRRT